MVPNEHKNPVKDLHFQEGAFDTYVKYGYLMFPQQRTIYQNIAKRLDPYSTVLEVGCGIGLGTAILSRSLTTTITGTDNLIDNVKMARALYPWIKFEQYDICKPSVLQPNTYDVIVAVEVIEHVENPELAIKELCSHALKEVWISTPNGTNKKRPPDNPYHVCEYSAKEVIGMIPNGWQCNILEHSDFSRYEAKLSDPIVYHLKKQA